MRKIQTKSKNFLLPIQGKIEVPDRSADLYTRMPVQNYAVGRSFDIQQKDENTTEITIYDVIGDYWGEGVSAKKFSNDLKTVKTKKIELKINSPGGNVYDGIAIYNELIEHDAEITVKIMGLAASAASLIAMAGDRILIASNAEIMIHNAWVMAMGNKNDFREVADILEEIDTGLAETYSLRTKNKKSDITAMMDKETWLRGQKAVDKGFADALMGEDEKAKAAFDISMFQNAPLEVKKEIEATLCEAGFSRSESKAAVNKGFHVLNQREADKHLNLREQREAAGDLSMLLGSLHDLRASLQTAVKK